MDFAAAKGSPIYAVADGTVRRSLFDRIYGNQTVIDFGGGVSSMYGHQSRSIVRPGQRVHRGQIIGYVGSTGRSTGPHLHFETWVNNKPVNPLSWFRWH
jgi:murein DD-endopeptidase MepM/ murein hydrolase activator NlpD